MNHIEANIIHGDARQIGNLFKMDFDRIVMPADQKIVTNSIGMEFLPVEQVSWNDVHRTFGTINTLSINFRKIYIPG